MILHSRLTSKRAALVLTSAFAMLAAALPGQGMAAPTNATASSTSTVVTPIAINKTADLSFGKFAASAAGDVTVSTSGARSSTGVTVISSSTTTAAKFDVSGEKGAAYTITIPGSVTLTRDGGTETMSFDTVSDLTGANTTTGNATAGSLDATTGAQTIFVGGKLNVAANQATGSYTGSLSVGVEYN